MIDRIIWKVILMIGGIAGSVFSIAKLSTTITEVNECEERLQYNMEAFVPLRSVDQCREELNAALGLLSIWLILLVVSIIIFAVGYRMKAESKIDSIS